MRSKMTTLKSGQDNLLLDCYVKLGGVIGGGGVLWKPQQIETSSSSKLEKVVRVRPGRIEADAFQNGDIQVGPGQLAFGLLCQIGRGIPVGVGGIGRFVM